MLFKRGFVQIPLLIGFVVMAVALPVANMLVQTNQENRGQAAAKATTAPAKVCVEGMLDWCTYRYKDCKTEYRCTQAPVKVTNKPVATTVPGSSCTCPCAANIYTGSTCIGTCGQTCGGTRPITVATIKPTTKPTNNEKVQATTKPTIKISPTKVSDKTCIPDGSCKTYNGTCCSGLNQNVGSSVCSGGWKCVSRDTLKITPTKVISSSGEEYKLNMTYNCGTHKCAWNQKAQHWIVENDPYKSKIVCVDDSSCKFVPTPTSYMQKTCVQWKLDGNGKCIGYEIKLYHTQAEGVVCERDYASNCDINKPVSTIAPTIKVLISPTVAKSPTPTINWKRVVSLCQVGVDYNHDGRANSLDMLKCFFEN